MSAHSGLYLNLRGAFCPRTGDGAPVRGLSRRGLAILAALACAPGHRMPRPALAALIWGERGEDQARASLRQELSALRRRLPPGALGSDRAEAWLVAADCETGDEQGDILGGLDIASPLFEDWLRDTRAGLLRGWTETWLAAAGTALEAQRPDDCAALAQAVLDLDPLNEDAMQLVLRAAARSGRSSAALRDFDRFQASLRRDLAVEPSTETVALALALRAPAAAAAPVLRTPPAQADRPRLAVMPFAELGGGQGDMFADGIVEEITGALSRVRDFHVIARQSAFALGSGPIDVASAAARLGAEYLVEGTVQRAGDRVRISVQLVAGGDGRSLWSARFDDRIDDLFALQDRIAAQVAGQLSPGLRHAEIARAANLPEAHRSAYSLTLAALPHFWAHRREDNRRAIAMLEHVVALSPDYAPALAYLAWALAQQTSYIWSDDSDRDRARAMDLAGRALELTSDHSPTLVAISAAYAMCSADQTTALSCAERALAIDPNSAWGWMRLGWCCIYQARFDTAAEHFAHAETLSPLDPFRFNMILGRAVGSSRSRNDPEFAIRLVREAMALAPGMTWANRMLAVELLRAGRQEEAEAALRRLVAETPGLTLARLRKSMPPAGHLRDPLSYEMLLRAGLPER